MQTIIETLAKSPLNHLITNTDSQIYHQIQQGYVKHQTSDEHSIIFANLNFLLCNKAVVDFLLGCLEADVRAKWQGEIGNKNSSMSLHQPDNILDLFGLSWPLPTAELASNHSNYLLNRTLLANEQAHGINLDDGDAPVPTFVGHVADVVAHEVLTNGQLWNEDAKISGLFYHGKMTHRIQWYLVMKAIELNILDVGGLKIIDLLQLVTTARTSFTTTLAWNLIFDNTTSQYNVTKPQRDFEGPIYRVLTRDYPCVISRGVHQHQYLYAGDPFFFHSYLLTHSRFKTPYLSECVTQSFAKSAFAIQRLENEDRTCVFYTDSPELMPHHGRAKRLLPLSSADIDMKQVLIRQAKHFTNVGWHRVDQVRVLADQVNTGKSARVKADKSFGSIQYRSIFAKPINKALQDNETESSEKRICLGFQPGSGH